MKVVHWTTFIALFRAGLYSPQSDALKVFFGAFGTFGK